MEKGSLELVLSSAAVVARPNKVLEYVWRKTARTRDADRCAASSARF